MKTQNRRIFSGVAGTMLLFSGAGLALNATNPGAADASDAPQGTTHARNGIEVDASWLDLEDDSGYVRASNVQGTFTFNQAGTTPSDALFNIFGATLTSMCSKPAVELTSDAEGVANYYVNVGGHIEKEFTVDVRSLSEDASEETLMACSCATGAPFGQAAVLGVPLSSVIEMADLEEGVNTVTAYGADGFGQPLPLASCAREERDGSRVSGKRASSADRRPGVEPARLRDDAETAARLLRAQHRRHRVDARGCGTRRSAGGPVLPQQSQHHELCRWMHLLSRRRDHVRRRGGRSGKPDCRSGTLLRRRPYLDDVRNDEAPAADKWVNWQFSTSFDEAGDYRMTVRARTADDLVSPLAATLLFTVS